MFFKEPYKIRPPHNLRPVLSSPMGGLNSEVPLYKNPLAANVEQKCISFYNMYSSSPEIETPFLPNNYVHIREVFLCKR